MPSLLEAATELPALLAATRPAAQGKRRQPEVAAFLMDAERECLRLQRSLRAAPDRTDAWRPGSARTFCIRDPKPRQITQLPFADRVVHHALCAVVDPLLERYAIFDSYACRPGKGQHAALRRAQRFVATRPGGWAVKGDVASYFASIPHDPLLALLARRVREPEVLHVLERIVRAYPSGPGRGLPIGALTSQHLANLYLGALDHYIILYLSALDHYIKDDLGTPILPALYG
jgi:retron-type reverse transcriptase